MDFTYLRLGFDHILDPQGYDHILFILVLCAAFTVRQWKSVLILITAFTVAHSLSLVLSGLRIVEVSSLAVEFLIPVTIALTALANLVLKKFSLTSHYLLAGTFGLIHGLGFSNFFKALSSPDESLMLPLLGFNIGVELGQAAIVAAYFLLTYIAEYIFGICHKYQKIFVSLLGLLESLRMIFFS